MDPTFDYVLSLALAMCSLCFLANAYFSRVRWHSVLSFLAAVFFAFCAWRMCPCY